MKVISFLVGSIVKNLRVNEDQVRKYFLGYPDHSEAKGLVHTYNQTLRIVALVSILYLLLGVCLMTVTLLIHMIGQTTAYSLVLALLGALLLVPYAVMLAVNQLRKNSTSKKLKLTMWMILFLIMIFSSLFYILGWIVYIILLIAMFKFQLQFDNRKYFEEVHAEYARTHMLSTNYNFNRYLGSFLLCLWPLMFLVFVYQYFTSL